MEVVISKRTSHFLDISRGICVVLVLLGHFRSFLIIDYAKLSSSDLITKLFYVVTSLGHYGVIIFFVISGYLCGARYAYAYNNFNIKKYAVNRISRVYVVFVPSVVLCLLLDYIGISLNIPDYHGGINEIASLSYSVIDSINFGNFLSTLILVNKHDSIFGSNTPLWSLSYEMYFYILFSLILFFLSSKSFKLAYIVLLVPTVYVINSDFLFYFFIWCLGLTVPYLTEKAENINVEIRMYWLIYWVAIIFLILILKLTNLPSWFDDIAVALLYCLLLAISKSESICKDYLGRCLGNIGKFSFSLYITHFPIGLLIFGSYKKLESNGEKVLLSIESLLFYMLVVIFTIIFSYFYYRIFELKNHKLKNYINEKVNVF